MTDAHITRMGRIAARLGLSEGQVYTLAIWLVLVVVLLSSLTDLTGRIRALAAPPPSTSTSTATTAPPSTESPSTTLSISPVGSLFPSFPPVTGPPGTSPPPSTPPLTSDPFDPLEGEDPPPKPECPAEPLIGAGRDVMVVVDALLGGAAPDATVVSALALVTGCSNTDPAILLVAGLIEIGQGIPDLGLDFIEFPQLPFLELPPAIIDLVQPAREAIDPICGTVATLNVVTSQVSPHYQPPFDAALSVSLFYALTTCGQLQDR